MASIERPSDLTGGFATDEEADSLADAWRYLVAKAAGQRVAISLTAAREILTVKSVTRLPGAPSWVAGLVNVRGTVLTVLDLPLRLGGSAASGPVVVVELEGRRFGLRVDGVEGVERASADEEAVDAARSAAGAVRGLAPLPAGAALVLDVAALQRAAIADA